ncbi:hypothetical protein SAMN05421823_10667 [Catalinimonas alkaloidigena]|uniref:Por secretion system C-terminal sorting domain-containing protein n=1 Tax=Catalinimonas alkaloidigena TaxID=1075417 RepID=A0A1G9K7F8_9BACT|nr:hypothetical protein [Catalinimonas alkaloidigena]SDL45364.1 hypothetical protein SAMN05421823_10667 [Catalinimonas alkaloidigena]
MKPLYYIFLMLGLAQVAQAGELVISGAYTGKNLYVRNPYNLEEKSFCTREVYVNDQLWLTDVRASAYEIDLSAHGLTSTVHVRIVHGGDCRPTVVNPQVLMQETGYQLSTVTLAPAAIRWNVRGDQPEALYFVEKQVQEKWVVISPAIASAGQASAMHYSTEVAHAAGENTYRIKALLKSGAVHYSPVATFTNEAAPVHFSTRRVKNAIELSRASAFEVLDAYGASMLKGEGTQVDISTLTPGQYFLSVDDQVEAFNVR